MPDEKETYKQLLSEIIGKQIVILGPDMAVMRARSVPGLEVNDEGKVLNFTEEPSVVVEKLVDRYVELSGQIVKNALVSIFAKYPSVKSKQE